MCGPRKFMRAMLEGRLLCCARCQARGFNCACACGDDKNWKRKWHQGLANQKAIRSRPTRRGAVQLGGAPPLSQYGATALLEAFSLDLATGCHGPLVALQSRKLSAIRAPWCESGLRGFSARHAGARESRDFGGWVAVTVLCLERASKANLKRTECR